MLHYNTDDINDLQMLLSRFDLRGELFTIGYNKLIQEFGIIYHVSDNRYIKLYNMHKTTFTSFTEQFEPSLNAVVHYFPANLINANKIINILLKYSGAAVKSVGITKAARNTIIGLKQKMIDAKNVNFTLQKGKQVNYAITKFVYSPENVELVKLLGAQWVKEKEHWKLTLDYASCAMLAEYEAVGSISLSSDVKAICSEIMNLGNELYKYSAATKLDEPFSIPLPPGLSLYDFQRVGVKFMHLAKTALVADEMGTGKTIMSLAFLNMLPNHKRFPVLIICPKTLKYNWYNEAKKWLLGNPDIAIISSHVKLLSDHDVYIINYDILYRYVDVFKSIEFNTLIADEAHYLKNPKARRTKAFVSVYRKSKNANVLFLTGTPITRNQLDIYNLVSLLKPGLFRTQLTFARRYCDAKYKEIYVKGGAKKKVLDTSGSSNLNELQKVLRSTVMLRRLKEDVLTQLPPLTRTLIPLELSSSADLLQLNKSIGEMLYKMGKLRTLSYNSTNAQLVKELKNKTLASIPQIRKLLFLVKYNYILDLIEDILDNTPKLVVFVYHREFQEKLMKDCAQYKPSGFHGGETSAFKRDEERKKFMEGDSRIFIGTYGAASEGLTLTASSYALMAEVDWNAKNVAQAEARIHRDTQKKPVTVYYPVVMNTLDEDVYNLLVKKLDVSAQALNAGALDGSTTSDFIDALADTIYVNHKNNSEIEDEDF